MRAGNVQQVFAIPVRNDKRCGARYRLCTGRRAAAAGGEPDQIGRRQRQGAGRQQNRSENQQRQSAQETRERRFHLIALDDRAQAQRAPKPNPLRLRNQASFVPERDVFRFAALPFRVGLLQLQFE